MEHINLQLLPNDQQNIPYQLTKAPLSTELLSAENFTYSNELFDGI